MIDIYLVALRLGKYPRLSPYTYHKPSYFFHYTEKWWEFNSCNTIFSHRLFGGEWYLPFNSELASKHVKKALFPCVFYTD